LGIARYPDADLAHFENLEYGASIEELVENHHVTREQIQAVLEFAARSASPCSIPGDAALTSDARPV
jgi:uncharacterized protein (DUF433 family)